MSQADIMNFLDKHPGKFYSGRELHIILIDKMSNQALYRGLKKVIKRDEYSSILATRNNTVRLTAVYGRLEDL